MIEQKTGITVGRLYWGSRELSDGELSDWDIGGNFCTLEVLPNMQVCLHMFECILYACVHACICVCVCVTCMAWHQGTAVLYVYIRCDYYRPIHSGK